MVPRSLLAFCFVLVLGAALAGGDEIARPSAFIDTDPVGARLTVDGVVQTTLTPTLLRGLAPGPHRVGVWKDGYRTTYRDFEVPEDGPATVVIDLPAESVVLAFPQTSVVTDSLGTMEAEGRQFRLPAGAYALEAGEGQVILTPAFPDEGLRVTAGWGLALLGTAFVASAASDVWHGVTGWSDGPTMLTAGLLSATLLELPWYLAIEGRKTRFLKERSAQASFAPEFPGRADSLSAQADRALEAGDLGAAEAALARLVAEAPDARLVGSAWFRLARIHAVTGRRPQAMGEYRLVAETFPQVETFDRARKALADLLEAEGRAAEALDQLDQMTGAGEFFSSDDLETQRARLTAAAGVADAK